MVNRQHVSSSLISTDKLFVSTAAFRSTDDAQFLVQATRAGLNLEFSSSLQYDSAWIERYLDYPLGKLPHNYFPAPEDPFVINLASLDYAILKRSTEHVQQGLRLAAQSKTPNYSVHAGFCLDPKPGDLGNQLESRVDFDRLSNYEQFLATLANLLAYARTIGSNLVIENNVLAPHNVQTEGINPLLCCDPEELLDVAEQFVGKNFGLLLDTGHLKVSAGTLGFDLDEAVRKLIPHIRILHHSDNDGVNDSNDPIGSDYWFLKWMGQFQDCLHVLEVNNQSIDEIIRQLQLLQHVGSVK